MAPAASSRTGGLIMAIAMTDEPTTGARRHYSVDIKGGGELPEQAIERISALFAEMAKSRYTRLFPDYPFPEFDYFMAWLRQLGVTFTEFAFHLPDPDGFALRAAALGPVGGWRVRDDANPDNPDGRALTPDEIAQLVAVVQSSNDARRTVRRRKKARQA
jgi:hypothetical protein